ncbi:radical SAM domain protein [Treponema primitia ZAS-2]|uniref:Radical SAM domain protein n=1 Tax=Treponema primitia (strain ATCC BAA-887 / DSM 12427 / ZAS-2) TaxID=545694 RepID=F5YK09_TREPZ|nr:radical SAM protein [Treponema primitia]AEF83693.1 radical SAM domain protein [Treponema primitia ZAS-2]
MSDLKETLYEELKLKLGLIVDGVRHEKGIFDRVLDGNNALRRKVSSYFEGGLAPYAFVLPHGFHVGLDYRQDSPYEIVEKNGVFSVTYLGKWQADISFPTPPLFYSKTTSDGVRMKNIGNDSSSGSPDRSLVISYSTECALTEKGKVCLFCGIERNSKLLGEDKCPALKNPRLIAETVKAAYDEGFKHITLTGGFVPERRELEYYLDVGEALRAELGVADFYGTACIGAPADLSVIDKYKETGFRTISFNTEVWGKQYFEIVNPGKVEMCGGYDNFIKAIEHAVDVFGKGRVRSNFVVGLQPKNVLFEGLEYLTSIGVVTVASSFHPCIGSHLEGHRSPSVDWHWDVQLRHAELLSKAGRTYEEIFYATPGRNFSHEIFQIENGDHPAFRQAGEKLAV